MKIKPTLKTFVYLVVVALSLCVLALVAVSYYQFKDAKPVYQGF